MLKTTRQTNPETISYVDAAKEILEKDGWRGLSAATKLRSSIVKFALIVKFHYNNALNNALIVKFHYTNALIDKFSRQ